MTDHPSNPPSQETEELIGQALDGLIEHDETTTDSEADRTECFANNRKVLLGLIDSALAAQEARHKAEMEKYREELVQISVWLPNHGGIGATVLEQVQTAVLEAESKLREATEREKTLVEALTNLYDSIPHHEGDDNLTEVLRSALAAIRSGSAQPPDKMAMGGSYKVALAAAFEAVKVLADYPPEQETPKPRGLMSLRGIAPDITGDLSSEEYLKLNWAGEIVYCACGRPTAGPAQCSKCAPPAHGGGD